MAAAEVIGHAPADRIDYLARTADVAAVLIGPGLVPAGIEALDPGVTVVAVDDDSGAGEPASLFAPAERSEQSVAVWFHAQGWASQARPSS